MNDRAPVSPEPSRFRSANDVWVDRVAKSGDSLAYRYRAGNSWRDVTWREADSLAQELAGGLVSLGLLPGDRIALIAQTRFEWMLCPWLRRVADGPAVDHQAIAAIGAAGTQRTAGGDAPAIAPAVDGAGLKPNAAPLVEMTVPR